MVAPITWLSYPLSSSCRYQTHASARGGGTQSGDFFSSSFLNQALKTKASLPSTHSLSSPLICSFYSKATYTPPSFSPSPLSQGRSLMAYTDSNVTARLTVDILPSFKICAAPLFPSVCSDCQAIVRGIAWGGGGWRDSSFYSLLIVWLQRLGWPEEMYSTSKSSNCMERKNETESWEGVCAGKRCHLLSFIDFISLLLAEGCHTNKHRC